MISISVESCRHVHRALQMLGQMENVNDPARGIFRGVVLNPSTPLEVANPLLDDLDVIFLLAVNPGWGGQRFIPSTMSRLGQLKQMIAASGKDILVGIDGGINKTNISQAAAGADVIVTGSAIFDGKGPFTNAQFMLQVCKGRK